MIKILWLILLLPWLLLPQSSSSAPALGGCAIFPSDNIWNTRIDTLPLHARSDDYVGAIGIDENMHPDFGSGLWQGGPIGIPFIVVPANQPLVDIRFTAYGDQSDAGPYPNPARCAD